MQSMRTLFKGRFTNLQIDWLIDWFSWSFWHSMTSTFDFLNQKLAHQIPMCWENVHALWFSSSELVASYGTDGRTDGRTGKTRNAADSTAVYKHLV